MANQYRLALKKEPIRFPMEGSAWLSMFAMEPPGKMVEKRKTRGNK
jgi:hypothetical protein